jgi:arabinogalactan oligomer/maltooligosaccharide transport system substrate-binding protein
MKKQLRLAGIVAGVAIIAAACGPSAGSAAPPADSTAPSVAPGSVAPGSEAPPAALEGEVTLWHSYGSGGGETGALTTVLDQVRAANPGLTINVVEQPFDQIFTKWRTDVAAGEGADMFIAPNDDLGKDAREESIANLDEYLAGNAALDGYLPVALDGSKVAVGDAAPAFYMVPESLKAVALWYDKAAVPTPPTTSDELLAAVKDGSVKIGINQGVYHQFGWTGAFGGTLMDDTGKCTADAGGFAEAFAYLKELKDAGATFNTDGNALKTDFQTGKINAIIDGPWQTADFRTALADKLAVTTIPAGPSGPANPFTGTDGWYVNPNLDPAQQALAVNVALALTAPAAEQVFVDDAGHVPANPAVTISDPITQGFADAAAAGLPRPQNAEFGNWWGPFGDALNKVIDTGADPATAVADACKLMNEASGL